MAKKLIRIHHPKQLDFEKYTNQDLNLVATNGSVYFGKIKTVKIQEIIFSDNLNNKRTFAHQDVAELIIDQIHSF